jgi:hypothetical protein
MAPERKSSASRRQKARARLVLKGPPVNPASRGADEGRSASPGVDDDLEAPESATRRVDAEPRLEVVDVVTADLRNDPRYEK